MGSPLSVKKNNYIKNPKRSDIHTPPEVCEFIHKIISEHYDIRCILDPCSGDNALTKPFTYADPGIKVIEFEKKRGSDFLKNTVPLLGVDLILINPPFNLGVGKKLGSELFLEEAFKWTNRNTPAVLFSPMGFRLNQKKQSKRWRWYRDKGPEITSILSLPLDIFPNVMFHNEVLFFNMPKLKAHYFLDNI